MVTIETVKDLFLQDLLPPSRKLMSFGSQGEALRKATKKQLIIMLYEDRLKNCYGKFVNALGKMANDTVEKLRGKAISIIQQLLTDHGEQEQVRFNWIYTSFTTLLPLRFCTFLKCNCRHFFKC